MKNVHNSDSKKTIAAALLLVGLVILVCVIAILLNDKVKQHSASEEGSDIIQVDTDRGAPKVSIEKSDELLVVFLNVGQGDAIYIEAPNGNQMIVDGGPGDVLSREVAGYIGPFDRSVDMIMNTNPDKDHYEGFISFLDSYDVEAVLEPSTNQEDSVYEIFQDKINTLGIKEIFVHDQNTFILDEDRGIELDILFPDRDVSNWSRNDGSIVAMLTYGDVQFLLMGDATTTTEGIVVNNEGYLLEGVDVLKLGHHGSKTSTGQVLLDATTPQYAIVSAGKENRYGHPHKEVIDRLTNAGVSVLETMNGSIEFRTDGKSLTFAQ